MARTFSEATEAIYVDSHGSLTERVAFLEATSSMAYFRRLVEDDLDVSSPRTILVWKPGAPTADYKTMRSEETKRYGS